jgi:DNA-binding Lrp family transcriptional regulator
MKKDMRQILKVLERDARATPGQIAALTGLPEAEVARQIAAWEAEGIIRRYKTVVDWEKFGEERVFAFIDVKVMPARGVGFDDVAERIYLYPEVHSVYLVSGTQDLRCVVEGRTMKEVADFVAQKLATIDRVNSTSTHFLLKKYKDDGDIFADSEADHRLMVTP